MFETQVKVKTIKLGIIPEFQIECHWSASNAKTSSIPDEGREGKQLPTGQNRGNNLHNDLDGSSPHISNIIEKAVAVPIGPASAPAEGNQRWLVGSKPGRTIAFALNRGFGIRELYGHR